MGLHDNSEVAASLAEFYCLQKHDKTHAVLVTMENEDMSGKHVLDKLRRWRSTGLGRAMEEGGRPLGTKEGVDILLKSLR